MSVYKVYKIYILCTSEAKLAILKVGAYPVFFQLFYLVPALLFLYNFWLFFWCKIHHKTNVTSSWSQKIPALWEY